MKRKIAVGAGIAVYLGLSVAVAAGAFGKPESQTEDAAVTADTEETQSELILPLHRRVLLLRTISLHMQKRDSRMCMWRRTN